MSTRALTIPWLLGSRSFYLSSLLSYSSFNDDRRYDYGTIAFDLDCTLPITLRHTPNRAAGRRVGICPKTLPARRLICTGRLSSEHYPTPFVPTDGTDSALSCSSRSSQHGLGAAASTATRPGDVAGEVRHAIRRRPLPFVHNRGSCGPGAGCHLTPAGLGARRLGGVRPQRNTSAGSALKVLYPKCRLRRSKPTVQRHGMATNLLCCRSLAFLSRRRRRNGHA